jgi:hypothetical protein
VAKQKGRPKNVEVKRRSTTVTKKVPLRFNVGIRFQPIGEDTTREENITTGHWALIFTPCDEARQWSFRVELQRDSNGVLSFPMEVFDSRVYAHPLATYTGYVDDIKKLMEVHPRRPTSYSLAYNNCQHWVATLLIFMMAFSNSAPGRQYECANMTRHNEVLMVLKQDGDKLYHRPNWRFHAAHLMAMGGGAAAVGMATIAAEATAMVQAPGLAGLIGFTVAAPTATAVFAATIALPFTAFVTATAGSTYVYMNYTWRRSTTFYDPRRWGCPTNGTPLSKTEMGELMGSIGGSLGEFSVSRGPSCGVLIGSYVGVNVAALSAALSPGAAPILAPAAAAIIVSKMGGDFV